METLLLCFGWGSVEHDIVVWVKWADRHTNIHSFRLFL